jgi:hypothetical protein
MDLSVGVQLTIPRVDEATTFTDAVLVTPLVERPNGAIPLLPTVANLGQRRGQGHLDQPYTVESKSWEDVSHPDGWLNADAKVADRSGPESRRVENAL